MAENIQLLVIDDHQVVREGIRRLLGEEDGIELVGQGSNSEEAMLQVQMLNPDIVLMDIKMPGVDGVELTRQLKQKYPDLNVIMLTLYDEYLNQALDAGARGYLLKDIRREELAAAIRKVHAGQIAISESIQSKVELLHEEQQDEAVETAASAKVDELQLVLSPPVEAGQLMRFAGCAEERLKSRVLQMVGAWEEGTVMTLALHKATPLSTLMSVFKDIPEIRQISREPLDQAVNPKLLKKVMSGLRIENKSRATLYISLARN